MIGLLIFVAALGIATLIGYALAADKGESNVVWKLAGHGFLGFFTLTINHVPLPLGYVIALLLASRATVNGGARRAAATTTFLIWLVGLLVR